MVVACPLMGSTEQFEELLSTLESRFSSRESHLFGIGNIHHHPRGHHPAGAAVRDSAHGLVTVTVSLPRSLPVVRTT